jgi:CheY-like chemotaxis protein
VRGDKNSEIVAIDIRPLDRFLLSSVLRRFNRAILLRLRAWRPGEVCEIPRHGGNITMRHSERLFRVLVVEDEMLLRWSLAEILRRSGHTVLEAASASEAREAMTTSTDGIDVVLLDLRLPDSSDLRLLEEVRSRMPHSAVIMMTAFGTPELVQGALERGVYCVMNKPFDVHAVEGVIRNAVGDTRLH